MRRIRFSPVLLSTLLVFAAIIVALYLRISLPFDKIYSDVGIKYASADAYYQVFMVDNLAHNFPKHMEIAPYLVYPGASGPVSIGLFQWFIATLAWIAGMSSPSQHTVDIVGVYLPAILGTLTIIPVYFIGKELFSRWAGVLAAGLIAILPGEFLGRSILGFTDYHVAETFLTAVTMLLLILAIKTANQNELTLDHLKKRDWAVIKMPLIYSLLAALTMSIYIFTWAGALMFAFIAAIYFVIQFIFDILKGKSTIYLSFTGTIFFLVTLILSLLFTAGRLYPVSLTIGLLIPLVLGGISWFIKKKQIKPVYFPLTLIGMGVVGVGLLYLINPSLFNAMLDTFKIFRPMGAQLTTIEMQPLISAAYGNPFQLAWGNFPGIIPFDTSTPYSMVQNTISFLSTSFFFSIITLIILFINTVRTKGENTGRILLVVWSLVILAAVIGQRRFGYYYSVNVAVLTGYLLWIIVEWISKRFFIPRAEEVIQLMRDRKTRVKKGGLPIAENFVMVVGSFVTLLIVVGLVYIVYAPNILIDTPTRKDQPPLDPPAILTPSQVRYAPSDAWVSSLNWMKENTPEPFGNPDAYYAVHQYPPPGESYQYPESAYGVLAWWDYGYWITRIGHRIPVANPSQDPNAIRNVASFFTATDRDSADDVVEELGVSYIVIDHETSLGKFYAIVTWSGKEKNKYFDTYLIRQEDGSVQWGTLYHPEYYQSMAARLYNFDGKAITPEKTMVVSYQEATDDNGNPVRLITGFQQLSSYGEAQTYLASQESGLHQIVGNSPFDSPVPLEAVEGYDLVHSSNSTISFSADETVPQLKIFKYLK